MKDPDVLLKDLLAHDAWIRALARKLVADDHAAEDVAQDTWVQALRKPPSRSGSFQAWTRRVVQNLAFRRWRSDASRRQREEAVAKPEGIPSVSDVLDREAMRFKVAKVICSLEEPYRTTILCRYFENLPPREVASRLGVSRSAVETQLKRGLQKLRARLDRDFGDRTNWCAALLPLTVPTAAEAAAATVTSAITGALVMSMKVKIGIAVLVALVVAYAFWPRGDLDPSTPHEKTLAGAPVIPSVEQPEPHHPPAAAAGAPEKTVVPVSGPVAAPVPRQCAIRGTVRNLQGGPIIDARVQVVESVKDYRERTVASVRTAGDGTYVLDPGEDHDCNKFLTLECAAAGSGTERRQVLAGTTQDFVLVPGGALVGTVVSAGDGKPVPGTRIRIRRYALEWTDLNNCITCGCRVTDDEGHFGFRDLKPGHYQIHVITSGHPRPDMVDRLLTVQAGEETRQDFALAPGVVAVGRVVDRATGEPVEGVTVSNWTVSGQKVVTDARGRFRIVGVDPNELHPGNFRVEGNGYVLSKSHLCRIGLPLEPVGAEVPVADIFVERLGTVSGRVLGPAGRPVAGARVATHQGETTTTGVDGAFHLKGLYPNCVNYQQLTVEARGFILHKVRLRPGKPGEARENVEVRLEKSGRIQGSVTDVEGKPLTGTVIQVSGGPRGYWRGVTDASGRYEVEVLPGEHRVEVVPRGFFASKASPFLRASRDNVRVRSDSSVTIHFTLKRGTAVRGRVLDQTGAAVEGVHVTASPQFQYLYRAGLQYTGRDTRRATSGPGGTFVIEGLHPVEELYDLYAGRRGYDSCTIRRISLHGEHELRIIRLARIHGRVRLTGGAPATDFWVHAEVIQGRKPRPGQAVIPERRYFADMDGRFDAPFRAGTYKVTAGNQKGARSLERTIEIQEGVDPPPLEFTLMPGAGLTGTLWRPDGKPAKRGGVVVVPVAGKGRTGLRTARADERGRYRVEGLAPGDYVLRAYHLDVKTWGAQELVSLDRGRTAAFPVYFMVLSGLHVAVRDQEGQPVAGARIRIRRADGVELHPLWNRWAQEYGEGRINARAFWFTDAAGVMNRRMVPPGSYVVEASREGYRTASEPVRAIRGWSGAVEIELEAAGRGDRASPVRTR